MSEQLDAVKTFYERFGAGDMEGASEVFTPDVETVTPPQSMTGRDAYQAYGGVFKKAFPDARMVIGSTIESGDTVAVEARFTGTHTAPLASPQGEIPATGRSLDLPFVDLFRFEGGLIASHHVYYDQMTFMVQLGLMPEPPAS